MFELLRLQYLSFTLWITYRNPIETSLWVQNKQTSWDLSLWVYIEGDIVWPHSLFPNHFSTYCWGVMPYSMPVLESLLQLQYVQEETPISSTWTLTPTYRASDLLSVSDTDIKTLFGNPTTMLLLHLSDDSITFVINPLICNGLYQCPSLMSFWKISSFFNWVNKVRTCITTRSNYKRQQRFESVTDELQGPCYHLESIWLSWFVK